MNRVYILWFRYHTAFLEFLKGMNMCVQRHLCAHNTPVVALSSRVVDPYVGFGFCLRVSQGQGYCVKLGQAGLFSSHRLSIVEP